MKIKLFYSYSHEDKKHREDLSKHLAVLSNDGLIDEWHDGEIIPGHVWSEEIEENINTSHIILLLFSPDFIASPACQGEVKRALKLQKERKTVFIPIILRPCAWKDIDEINKIEALPPKGKPVTKWSSKDEAWVSVYDGIKKQVVELRQQITPKIKTSFENELMKNPIIDCTLEKIFIYPDISEINKSKQKLKNIKISSEKLKNILSFKHDYILLEGEEQSGKTSLCNMLYLHYVKSGLYPILIKGSDITGKANIRRIVNNNYGSQYDCPRDYWSLNKETRVLLIDDIHLKNANSRNYSKFLLSIKEYFKYTVIFIDKLSNLSDKSTEHDYFYLFNSFTIKSLGYKKRDELIKKCIANDDGVNFSFDNQEQVAKLDKNTNHIDSIIGTNIVPSYPIFIISAFNIIESSSTTHDSVKTSYGHCYHAMITMKLDRANVNAGDMEMYFNLLTELAYFMFRKNTKSISKGELNIFLEEYKKNYICDKNTFSKLISSNIIMCKSDKYSFQYIYIYYYFVAQYIADNLTDKKMLLRVEELMSDIHKKDNSNIIVLITHHTKNKNLLDKILSETMSVFKKFPEATLSKKETSFISESVQKLKPIKIPPKNHNPENTRNRKLKQKDVRKSTIDNTDDDLLLVEIRKSAKSIEIIGQILKNQYGRFKKSELEELFIEGQNVGLRLLRSFFKLMNDSNLDDFIQERLTLIAQKDNKNLTREEIQKFSGQIITRFSYSIIFGWIHKVVNSLGYEKITEIADIVDKKTDTVASTLINFSIHAWHIKNIDFDKLKQLFESFDKEKNEVAKYLLMDIVSSHLYMHKVPYKLKQKINSLLGFSIKGQLAIQQKIRK